MDRRDRRFRVELVTNTENQNQANRGKYPTPATGAQEIQHEKPGGKIGRLTRMLTDGFSDPKRKYSQRGGPHDRKPHVHSIVFQAVPGSASPDRTNRHNER